MAVIVVGVILLCSGLLWNSNRTFLVTGQSCVNESRFQEQVVYVGQRALPYRLQCPLKSVPPQSSAQIQITWLKDCREFPSQVTQTFLDFPSIRFQDEGNYTCVVQDNSTASFTVYLRVKESQCAKPPEFKPSEGSSKLWGRVGSAVKLNCTSLLWDSSEEQCDLTLQWHKNGQLLSNHTYNTSSWPSGDGQLMVCSLLEIILKGPEDYGVYSCTMKNSSLDFVIQNSDNPSHTAAVIAAVVLLILLTVAAVVYSQCHLNIKLWYRNLYGDYELNDGKLYDAYISYVNNDADRKFVNFILKPHLENQSGYKVQLCDNDILPGAEPSAELLMNMSRSRRLIVLLSHAYLEQDWCFNNFRQGLLHLLEICQQPILIMLDGQYKQMSSEVKQQLGAHQHRLTVLTWRHNSVIPSSAFWKELALAMPRHVFFHKESAGDPQTMLQDDKDPMLTLDPDYLDCRSEIDPAGDLGVRLPVYRALACKAPVLPAAPLKAVEPKPSDLDVSDLGSRNYGARSDFYCLVTEDI